MLNDEEENGKLKGKKAFRTDILKMKYKRQVSTFHAENRKCSTFDQAHSLFYPMAAGMPGDAGRDKWLSLACICDLRSWQEPAEAAGGAGSGAQGHRIKLSFYATF